MTAALFFFYKIAAREGTTLRGTLHSSWRKDFLLLFFFLIRSPGTGLCPTRGSSSCPVLISSFFLAASGFAWELHFRRGETLPLKNTGNISHELPFSFHRLMALVIVGVLLRV